MPELPDIVAYLAALEPRVVGRRLEALRLASPFLVRSVSPPIREADGKRVLGLRRMGKRIVFELEEDLYLVLGDFAPDGSHATIKIQVNRMVSWLWIGGLVLTLGAALAILPDARRSA